MFKAWSTYINQSVSRKLAFYIISIGLMVACAALFVRLALYYQQHLPELEKRAFESASILLPPIQTALEQHDNGAITTHMARLSSSPDIKALRITWINANGREQNKTYPKAIERFTHPITFKPSITKSSTSSPTQITAIEIDLDLSQLKAELKHELIKNVIIILAEALLLVVILILFMESLFARHLRDMSVYANKLDIGKLHEGFQLKRGKKAGSFDELDELTSAFNIMRKKLLEDVKERQVMELTLMAEKEEKLRTRRKQLAAEASDKAKGQFIATVSHEIRTPMNGIIGMIDLLSLTQLSETQKQYIATIKHSGSSLITVINDILDYSKIEADKLKLENTVFDLGDLIDNCIQLFSATTQQKHIELLSIISPDTPRLLLGDPTRLRQVILNLLGNAFKFTQKGCIHLKVFLADHEGSTTPTLLFSVKDTGIGIAKEAQKNLFQAFNQADNTITREYGGTGLGLAISQNLVSLMGGEMGVESDLGHGATFWFTSRFQLGDKVNEDGTDKLQEEQAQFSNLNVLIVEDNAVNRMVIEGILNRLGIKSQIAENGAVACQLITTKTQFDVIFMDCEMPVMDGFAACQNIRHWESLHKQPRTPIVALTAHVESEHKKQVFSCGMDYYLSKPITLADIRKTLLEIGFHSNDQQSSKFKAN